MPTPQTRPDQSRLSTDLEKYLDWYAANDFATLGNTQIADAKRVALFCSKKCPGSLIIHTHDLAHALRDARITVIGGFHSPVERECLNVLLKGSQPLIICPARSLDSMRIPMEWRVPIEEGRLLLLSPFEKKHRRATAELAQKRNEFVAALADTIFVAYASAGGVTERLCQKALTWEKRLLTFKSQESDNLVRFGVEPVEQLPIDCVQTQRFWIQDSNRT